MICPGATILPLLFSTDKTQVTQFGNKSVYPVYMTIGNIPKDIRRKPSRQAYVLLGYLPTTRLEHVTNKSARRRMLANLFHSCMKRILSPLKAAGETGVNMTCGNGATRRTHPLFACFVSDYPEQVLACGCKTGECPKCDVPYNELGEFPTTDYNLRDLDKILDALSTFTREPNKFNAACRDAGIKAIPTTFWQDLPYADIHLAITPDILHQLYQGVVKHVVAWVTAAFGEKEIDARCRRFPPNHNIRIFSKGISSLSRVTGKEHADMCRTLLGLVIDLPLPGGYSPIRLIRAVRAILDFLYLAQYPVQTTETLECLDDALNRFHQNKQIFVDIGVRSNFNLPKVHALSHYIDSIRLFGTTDNYNTEYTERLHIDLAKDAYRATNKKDEYAQMTVWLERKEKVLRHAKYISWRLGDAHRIKPRAPTLRTHLGDIRMTKWPTANISMDEIAEEYGATFFRDALARYVVESTNPNITHAQREHIASNVIFPFRKVPVFHKIKIVDSENASTVDSIHVQPARRDKYGKPVSSRFDTCVVKVGEAQDIGVTGAQ